MLPHAVSFVLHFWRAYFILTHLSYSKMQCNQKTHSEIECDNAALVDVQQIFLFCLSNKNKRHEFPGNRAAWVYFPREKVKTESLLSTIKHNSAFKHFQKEKFQRKIDIFFCKINFWDNLKQTKPETSLFSWTSYWIVHKWRHARLNFCKTIKCLSVSKSIHHIP